MNLIDARHLSNKEIDRFAGDLRAFLLMLKDRFDREKLKTAVAMHRETWYALSEIKKDKRYVEYINSVSGEKMEGGVNMDAALDYIEERGEARGETIGIDKVNQLILLLSKDGRMNDCVRSAMDKEYQKKLFVEYGLEKGNS